MRDALSGALPIVEHAVAACEGVASEPLVATARETVGAVRTRLSYPDEVVVVALAGGTGSGKSSLLNALVSEEIADVGGVRPTTSQALAAVPERFSTTMSGYLDALSIPERAEYDAGSIVWIDLPDTDSLEVEHRLHAEALIPVVDVIVWVFDPEKYRDARTHNELIRPLATHGDQLVFVLNQSDRLQQRDLDLVLADLRTALVEDGVSDPRLISVAAGPPAGPPIGTDGLSAVIEQKRSLRSMLYRKLIRDLHDTLGQLADDVGSSVDFDNRAEHALAESVAALARDDREAAIQMLESLYSEVAATLPGPLRKQVTSLMARVPTHVQRVSEGSWSPGRKKLFGKSEPPGFQSNAARELLVESVIRPLRAHLARRAIAGASLTEASLAIGAIESRG